MNQLSRAHQRAVVDPGKRVRLAAPLLGSLATLAACAPLPYEEHPLDAPARAAAFAERRLDSAELAAFAHENLAPDEPFPPPAFGLDALVLAAFFYRAELDLARAELAEARAGQVTAGARANPRLSLAPEVVPGAADPWILGWNLELPLETAGKRGLRLQAAEAHARASALALPQAAWRVRAEVRAAWIELAAARAESALLVAEHATQAERVRTRRALLVSGRIAGPDLLREEQELARLALASERGATRFEHARAGLARAVGIPRANLEAVELAAASDTPWPEVPSAEAARELGLVNRLDLRAGLHEYAAAEAELGLEIARQYPDVSLLPGTSYDQGDHKFALGFALELPLFGHNEGPIAAAEARRAASAARFLALQDDVIGALEGARADYAGALR